LHYSRAQRDRRQPIAVEPEHLDAASGAEPSAVPGPGPLDWDTLDENLARALDQLPEEYQSVMLLWAVEDLAYKEIADVLQIPIGTVMSRLHRARQRLSEQLRGFARQEGIIRE